ncbi:putative odorant receptor 71a [Diabrotica virgifera virgifera]|uniref:Odorant receptor n=1 Tax=Diabrotica virgifera virgifera TaxID=50390 RepID=A0ABM5K4T0_DIAVI|nr:putative odorant receptor 71a [Diabrotica virgifera virgifera]
MAVLNGANAARELLDNIKCRKMTYFGYAVLKTFMLYFDKKRVQYFYDTITNEFWDYQIAGPGPEAEIKRKHFRVYLLFVCEAGGAFGIIFFLSILPIIERPEGKVPLPFVNWTPFDIDSSPIQVIFRVTMVLYLMLSIASNTVFDGLFFYGVEHLIAQLILLKVLLENIAKDIMEEKNDCEKFSSDKFQNMVYSRLKLCIAHHVKLLKFGKNLQEFCSATLLPQLLMTYFLLVINGFVISISPNELAKVFVLSCISTCAIVELSVYAIPASDLQFEGLSVMDSTICSDWYLFRAPLKKALTFMLIITQEPIFIKAGGLYVIHNPVIIDVAQKAFSAIVLLRALIGVD